MSEATNNQNLLRNQPNFHLKLLTVLGVTLMLSSFVEHDRRGLLFHVDPAAFSANDAEYLGGDMSTGSLYAGGYGTNVAYSPRGYDGEPRRGARRFIPRRDAGSGSGSQNNRDGSGMGGGPDDRPTGLAGSDNARVALNAPAGNTPGSIVGQPGFIGGGGQQGTPVGTGGGGVTGGSVPGIGFVPGPVGFIPALPTAGPVPPTAGPVPPIAGPGDPTDPTTPVNPGDPGAPAVPEPASWLLMIIGIGALGFALRREKGKAGQTVEPAYI